MESAGPDNSNAIAEAGGVPPDLLPARPMRVDAMTDSGGALGAWPANGRVSATGPKVSAVRFHRVAAVVPCFNRRADAEALLTDLGAARTQWTDETTGLRTAVDLRVLLVDNASDVPLSGLEPPRGVRLDHLRLSTNTGGSGGYNAGMRRVLALDEENEEALAWRVWDAEYVWLVDSDARVGPETLRTLLEAMWSDATIVAAGSTICDPLTGQAFELGGHVNRRVGHYEPMTIGNVGIDALVDCDYVAACCALVRSDAVRDTGVFPDRFLNGDDVEWFIRMKATTGGRVVGVPWSLAMHPRFDRFPTWPRYYMTRNAFGPLDAVGGGSRLRLIRALREVPRAVQQDMMGRRDLAKLHMAGLRHAARHKTIGPAPEGLIHVDPALPISQLSGVLREMLGMARPRPTTGKVLARLMLSDAQRKELDEELMRAGVVVTRRRNGAHPEGTLRSVWGAVRRLILGPEVDVAVVPARGRPDAWFLGRTLVEVGPQGFVIRRTPRVRTTLRACGTLLAGFWHSVRVARRGDEPIEPMRSGLLGLSVRSELDAGPVGVGEAPPALSMCAVILSYNRERALERTLKSLRDSGLFSLDEETAGAPFSAMVVDNASTDESCAMVGRLYPRVRVVRMDQNLGVEAFNRAVEKIDADVILILDDDATPDPRALRRAMDLLARRPDLAAVTLHPRHPASGASEWAAARHIEGGTSDHWPLMGCANLVRRDDWRRVGGYEGGFFLYRNDADLALKLLGQGRGVHFNPAWAVWHDSPSGAGARKSERWHEMATRNWVWMARRHGRGLSRVTGALLGWVWAHKLAGLRPRKHLATLRGAWRGITMAKPPVQRGPASGAAWRRLLGVMTQR